MAGDFARIGQAVFCQPHNQASMVQPASWHTLLDDSCNTKFVGQFKVLNEAPDFKAETSLLGGTGAGNILQPRELESPFVVKY